MSRVEPQYSGKGENFVLGLWGVRYQVEDVGRAVAFYTERLGFKLDQQNLPVFAQVSVGHVKLILSGPGASGSRPMPDGRKQEPGGWNRIVLQVQDLPARIEALRKVGVHFRNKMKWVLAEDRFRSRTLTAIPSNCSSLPSGSPMFTWRLVVL